MNINVNTTIGITLASLIIIALFSIVPFVGVTIDDSYTVTDTSTDGWNTSTNTDLDTTAQTWSLFIGWIVLGFIGLVVGIIIIILRDMD